MFLEYGDQFFIYQLGLVRMIFLLLGIMNSKYLNIVFQFLVLWVF